MVDHLSSSEVETIRARLSELPIGSISYKTIKGKKQPYLQWSQDGKTKSRYLKAYEREEIIAQVEERKRLEAELKALAPADLPIGQSSGRSLDFNTNCLTGPALERFASMVDGWKRRACFEEIEEFLRAPSDGRVLVLYGLRRTGKSTMIRQAILRMDEKRRSRTAYITLTPADDLKGLNRDLRRLFDEGFDCVFVDEVTMLDDFIESASLFSDVYAAMGMKVVLSGTDSLGFLFSEDEQLYDRCAFVHTTFIPYGEFERVLGIHGVDEYIRFGGTMSLSGTNYNIDSPFSSAASAGEYVDSAIAKNIQHSLKCYQYGGHFRNLQELYDAGELTSAINRVVEDINHRFTVDVLTRQFASSDLALSTKNMQRDPQSPSDVLERVDVAEVTMRLRQMLDILEAQERTVPIRAEHALEIKEYLDLLDLTVDVPIIDASNYNARRFRVALTQPGLRYAQAKALITSLIGDDAFRSVPLAERKAVAQRILDGVRGRMLEDLVLLETGFAQPQAEVFKLQFAIGEFDMVVFRPDKGTCSLYEIKHSAEEHPSQRRHLLDADKLAATEIRFGTIQARHVLYRGNPKTVDGISYVNVEEYLRSL